MVTVESISAVGYNPALVAGLIISQLTVVSVVFCSHKTVRVWRTTQLIKTI